MQYRANKTVPPKIAITSDRSDIVIIDNEQKKSYIFELTLPFEPNIDKSHTYKMNKYAYIETDSNYYATKVTPLAIGSRGFITKDNENRLKELNKFVRKGIPFKKFMRNISQLVVNSSYYILICRKEYDWDAPMPLKP